jgi:hypothetical protein
MKLEDLPKKEIFTVPDGYFEKLPGVIQARVAAPSKAARPVLRYTLQYALPVVVLLAAGIFWFAPATTSSTQAETLLADVNTEDLIAFLNDTDISTDELLDHGTLDASDASEIEGEVYGISLDDESIDALTEEYDLNNL